MNKDQDTRRESIIDLLVNTGEVYTSDLSELFHVTSETIRKDLLYLESLGVLEKHYGKAVLSPSYINKPVSIRKNQNVETKKMIGNAAVQLIKDGTVIFLDGGSTCLQVAEQLIEKHNITVITNSLAVAQTISSQESSNEVYLSGGLIKKSSLTVEGDFVVDFISKFRTSIAFMGTDGLLYQKGPTCKDVHYIDIKAKAIEQAESAVLLCASDKFSLGSVRSYAKWSDFSHIITDSGISDEQLQSLRKETNVITVGNL